MLWDGNQDVAPGTEEGELTPDEWNQHVTDGHFPADELNFGIDGGDPVMTDPQANDAVVLRWDRSAETWVMDSLSTESLESETLSFETSDRYPQSPRQLGEFDGLLELGDPHYVDNPVLTADDVTDTDADFVADPFLLPSPDKSKLDMFFEVKESSTGDTIGAHATSTDGVTWSYNSLISFDNEDINDYFSYYVPFRLEGTTYLVVGERTNNDLAIFEESNYPTDWKLNQIQSFGDIRLDPTPFEYNGSWYLIYEDTSNNTRFFHSDSLLDANWSEHPNSPLFSASATDKSPAGRPITQNGRVNIFVKKTPSGGNAGAVENYTLSELNTSSLTLQKAPNSPIIKGRVGSDGWKGNYMHHIDVVQPSNRSQPIAIVDANNNGWKIGVHTLDNPDLEVGGVTILNNYSLDSGSTDVIPFDTFNYSSFRRDDLEFDLAEHEFIAPTAGYYRFYLRTGMASDPSGSGELRIQLLKNSNFLDQAEQFTDGSKQISVQMERDEYLDAGGIITPRVYQDMGGAVDLRERKTQFTYELLD